jgi:hypothetical protein
MGRGSGDGMTRSGKGGGGDRGVSTGAGVGTELSGAVTGAAGVAATSAAGAASAFATSGEVVGVSSVEPDFAVSSALTGASFSLRRRRKKDIPTTETWLGAFTAAADMHRIVFRAQR